jgi:hypothetical protein
MSRAVGPFGLHSAFSRSSFASAFSHRFRTARKRMNVAVPPNTVPTPVFIAIHDFERRDRALMPVLNLALAAMGRVGDAMPKGEQLWLF